MTNAVCGLAAPPPTGSVRLPDGLVTTSMPDPVPPDLIPAQRHAHILEYLRRIGGGSVNDLSVQLGVSASTIRRDLEHLTARGYLERTHGGAVIARSQRTTFEPEFAVAAQTALGEKGAIGAEAARRIEPGQCVILDTGSTVFEAARHLATRDQPLTVVTNNIAAAQLFSNCRSVRTVVTGGSLLPDSMTLWGEPGEQFLASIHADICLLGAHAVTGQRITESSLEGAAMKRAMIRSSRKHLLLVDSSKFQPASFSLVTTLDEISEVITDDGIAAETLTELRAAGVAVTVVAPQPGEP
jgi:DeoR family transcriptional regulator, aga operon transcriptional repressor